PEPATIRSPLGSDTILFGESKIERVDQVTDPCVPKLTSKLPAEVRRNAEWWPAIWFPNSSYSLTKADMIICPAGVIRDCKEYCASNGGLGAIMRPPASPVIEKSAVSALIPLPNERSGEPSAMRR